MHHYYEMQEEVIKKHVQKMHDIQDLLALEDLAALQIEISEVENRGKEYVNNKMPPIHETLARAKPVHPYKEAISNIQQFIEDNEIAGFNRSIQTIQPYNRTTKAINSKDSVASRHESSSDVLKELYRRFAGSDPFTCKQISFTQWKESAGWRILSLYSPARFVKGGNDVGKAGKRRLTLRAKKQMAAKEKLSQLSKLANKTSYPQEEPPMKDQIDRLVSEVEKQWAERQEIHSQVAQEL